MNKDLKDLKPLLINLLHWFKRYGLMIGLIIVSLMYAGLIIQINLLNRRQPTDEQVNEKLEKIVQPSINEDTVNKLKDLEENSKEVKSLFKNARNNPFQE
jgi:hypothetical protein